MAHLGEGEAEEDMYGNSRDRFEELQPMWEFSSGEIGVEKRIHVVT